MTTELDQNLPLKTKPDAAEAMQRIEAWWHREILDRPCIQIHSRNPNPPRRQPPRKEHASIRERWMDAEYQVASAVARVQNGWYGGEAFPNYNPNLGPDMLSAAFGCELEFGETTSWSVPCLDDWDDLDKIQFDPRNEYVQCILEMTRLGVEMGADYFFTGLTDIHPGGDLAAAIRDPQQLCMDIALEPEQVMRLVQQIERAFFDFYELQYQILLDGGQRVTTAWLPLYHEGRYYIPSNDFSCMISEAQFEKYFIPELEEECRWLDRGIYHLDGPDALRHLDRLLDIPELDAIQWAYGAGNGPASKWMDVYKRIQAAGKNIHAGVGLDELDTFMAELNPEGVMLSVGAPDIASAEEIIKKVAKWTRKQS